MKKTVLVGHLDTGVSAAHPALRGKIAHQIVIDENGMPLPEGADHTTGHFVFRTRSDLPGFANLEGLTEMSSSMGADAIFASHGTHTAGIICGDPAQGVSGVAPDARLCVVAVSTSGKNLLNLLAGMDALLNFDIRIACMAVGVRKQTPVFAPFLDAFLKKGVLPILPVGNSGEGAAHAPACYPGALAVGAVNEHGRVADFSGSFVEGAFRKPELLAPGVNIFSALPNGKTSHKSGTSMACAYVAGVAARLLQVRPDAGAAELKHVLLATARSLPQARQHRCHYGIVNPEAALEAIQQPFGDVSLGDVAVPVPEFLQTRYIDNRFLENFRRAGESQLLEAILLPQKSKRNSAEISAASRRLVDQVEKKSGQKPVYTRYFQHADAAHVQAGRKFFATLLEHPGLFACSAVDQSIFDD